MSGRPTQQTTGKTEVAVTVRMIEDFGIAQCQSSTTINIGGKSVPDSTGYSYFTGSITPTISNDGVNYKYNYKQVAFSPPEAQKQLILPGWNSASVLIANNLAGWVLNKYSSISSPPEQAIEIAAIVWCMHFQQSDTLYVPRIFVNVIQVQDGVVTASYNKTVGGKSISIQDAKDLLGQVSIQDGSTQQVFDATKATGGTGSTNIADAILSIDISSIGNNKIVYRFSTLDIVSNWSFWGQRSDDMSKPKAGFPLPPAAVFLQVNDGKTNVNFRSTPSTSGKVISQFDGGKLLIENSALKSGWWGAYDPQSGSYGYISSDYVTPVQPWVSSTQKLSNQSIHESPHQSTSELSPDQNIPANITDQSTALSTQNDASQPPSNTMLYIGIGAASLVCIGAIYLATRKKKTV